ncbi:MAG: PD-(D/E)XK nuclease family protein [Sulfurimonas sp.]|uniref:PDDEXK-like family protein n=1 Tax=Sulfurimonas sp. TaxID=2022749 RepID=UPI002627835D|nr:PD-(D/E)XK nuclease family protein [Sulfurimonas sp.]MDD5372173.1 PD-(D/E)XK nuclease family protein [Sulfurimonas sp.]
MQQEEKQTIKSIIAQVIKINEKYEEIKKIKGESFNIFSILKLDRYEVQMHSNFIYELLNPKGSHNQGTLFLELFLKNTLDLGEYGGIKNIYQEYPASNNRRIDFVLETQNYQIGIEMKIDAGDQDKQLLDYKKELDKSNKESKLYYLTLTGYEASKESTNGLKVDKDYFLLSFRDDIYNWIEECIEKSATIPLLREGLVHYKNLIGKITNKISIPMEKEMEEVINTPKQVEAAQIILNEYPKIWAKKEMEFWDALEERLQNFYLGKKYEFRDINNIWLDKQGNELPKEEVIERIYRLRYIKYVFMGFSLEKEYKNNTSVYLMIVQLESTVSIYLSFYAENGEIISMNSALKAICENISFTRIYDKNKRYKNIDEKIIFYGRYQTEPTYDLFNDKQFNNYVDKVAREVENTINQLEENEKAIAKAINS